MSDRPLFYEEGFIVVTIRMNGIDYARMISIEDYLRDQKWDNFGNAITESIRKYNPRAFCYSCGHGKSSHLAGSGICGFHRQRYSDRCSCPEYNPGEDKNGHKTDKEGSLIFDERCRNCDAPKRPA